MMPNPKTVIEIARLRPTQITIGKLEVRQKREKLRIIAKRPTELIEFILLRPIRVVWGPRKRAYVIDHHHLAIALMKEDFETAPMDVEADFSDMTLVKFWRHMLDLNYVHPFDARGRRRDVREIPSCLTDMEDDPFRSLAGFVREKGGFAKTETPFAEFRWADFFRTRIKEKLITKNLEKAIDHALFLAGQSEASRLPGFMRAKERQQGQD